MLDRFVQFLQRSPTVYHAARNIMTRLDEADFTPLSEGEKWELELGQNYYVQRDDALIAAFRIPQKIPAKATIVVSHIDSPALKIKPHPELSSNGIGQILTETYGGPLLHTWLDRDLAIAGRIITAEETKFVFLDHYPAIIPGIAIHLDRTMNEKGLILKKQDHLKAIFTLSTKELPLNFSKLLGFDLFLVPIEKPSFIGLESEFIASYRLDNLTSAFASLEAITEAAPNDNSLQMAFFWDHEEIGSQTYAGADSFFAGGLLERILNQFEMTREDYYRLKSQSFCLSCDVGHAFNPNYAEKYDTQNAPLLGKGPIVKYSSKYATNGASAAPLFRIAEKRKLQLQTSANHSDLSGGGTVGAMMAANLGIATVDLGIGCWSMHSIRETISSKDQVDLTHLLKAVYESL